jgi:hypothetical protein
MKLKTSIGALVLCFCMLGSALADQALETVTDPVKVFEQGYLQVVGSSEEGQSRYRALRAAQVVAQRDLLEAMQGLHLYGNTSIKDGMLQSDDIKTTVEGYLRGATKCGQEYDAGKGYADVCMRVYIRGKGGLYDVILPLMKDDRLMPEKRPAFKPSMPNLKPEVMEPGASGRMQMDTPGHDTMAPPSTTMEAKPEVKAPSELTHPHDGLIIDARDFKFRPALVNRVLTEKDEVVFEPSKIVSTVLVERGCGGFTTDDGKAKALLESWGSKNPMIVKCTDVQKFTDAKISQDDAAAVYVNDQKSNLLAQARVVFILK